MRVFLISILFCFIPEILFPCSCDLLSWCDFKNSESKVIMCWVKPIEHVTDENGKLLCHLEVSKVFRDDIGLTERITLFGLMGESSCYTNVHFRFKLGIEYYLAIDVKEQIEIPSSPEIISSNWNFTPHLCSITQLTIDHDRVYGHRITDDLREYPLAHFEERAKNCDFGLEELYESSCNSNSYYVFPNPTNGKFKVRNRFFSTPLEKVQIYDSSGQLIMQRDEDATFK